MPKLYARGRTVMYTDTVRVPTPGTPVQFQPYRVPPGCSAQVQRAPGNVGIVFAGKFPRPRQSAGVPSGGALSLLPNADTPITIDADVLSQWFVDADTANEGIQVEVYLNQ